jgi:hypothetical protein
VDEARGLHAAVTRASGNGITPPDLGSVEDALVAFDRVAAGVPWKGAGLPADVLAGARSVLEYYEHAAVGLTDHVPAARSAESWFVHHTEAGRTMRAARRHMREHGAPQPLWFSLLPATQP